MRVKLITLRYSAALEGFDDAPLVEFVRDKQLLEVRSHFFAVGERPFVACLLTYRGEDLDPVPRGPRAETEGGPSPSREDPAPPRRARGAVHELVETLAPHERALFATLREWRTRRARALGIPPYGVLTNRQLVDVLRARPATRAALLAISGIGEAKVRRFGDELLRLAGPSPAGEPAEPAS